MEEIKNSTWKPISLEHKLAFSVDCVIFAYDETSLKVLLIKCNMPQFKGQWSLMGDLVSVQEDIEDAAKRVMGKYTSYAHYSLEQVYTFGSVNRHPLGRVISTAYYTLFKFGEESLRQIDSDHQWFEVKDVKGLAFDHDLILEECINKIRKSLRQSPIGFSFLPEKFTLSHLQNLYEVVLDIQLDKRNFRRKLKKLDLLIDTGETQREVSHRPAKLYQFNFKKYRQKHLSGIHFEI